MDKKRAFTIIFVAWLALMLAFIGIKEFTIQSGTKVLLKTRPVDPRDMFRGDYVALSYEISGLDAGPEVHNGDTVYVYLENQGFHHAVKEYSTEKKQGLFIKGKVESAGDRISVKYGIESYFVPEGKGREIEMLQNTGDLYVMVSVDRFGNAVITDLFVNDTKISYTQTTGK
ncbi:MAG: GDYXXLXY domain-containing protein [archaeon]